MKLVTAVLYPVSAARARPIRLPVLNDPGDDPHATGLVDDVRLDTWFPNGALYTHIHDVPGTSLTLSNDYTIVTARQPTRAPHNKAADVCFNAHVKGNLVVLRHHQRYRMSLTNVHSSERRLIDYVVQQ